MRQLANDWRGSKHEFHVAQVGVVVIAFLSGNAGGSCDYHVLVVVVGVRRSWPRFQWTSRGMIGAPWSNRWFLWVGVNHRLSPSRLFACLLARLLEHVANLKTERYFFGSIFWLVCQNKVDICLPVFLWKMWQLADMFLKWGVFWWYWCKLPCFKFSAAGVFKQNSEQEAMLQVNVLHICFWQFFFVRFVILPKNAKLQIISDFHSLKMGLSMTTTSLVGFPGELMILCGWEHRHGTWTQPNDHY